MRKEVKLQLYKRGVCQINVRNIFGFMLNQVEDRIKRNKGVWDPEIKKFTIESAKIQEFFRDCGEIDRSICLEQPPQVLYEILRKYQNSKPRKQILQDVNFVGRYEHVSSIVTKALQRSRQGPFPHKIPDCVLLVLCPEFKINTWMQVENTKTITSLPISDEQISKKDGKLIWLGTFEQISPDGINYLKKIPFTRLFIDQLQSLFSKQYQNKFDCIKKLCREKQCYFFISKPILSKIDILSQMLQIIIPGNDLAQFRRRYFRENLWELKYLLKTCSIISNINESTNGIQKKRWGRRMQPATCHHFNKLILHVSESSQDKIRAICKKFSNLDQKRILENIKNIKNKSQKQFFQSINETLIACKTKAICEYLLYLTNISRLKCVVVIETTSMYRDIQNFLCEQQMSYCHYEHPRSVIDFNRNPILMVCLVRVGYLLTIDFQCDNEERQEEDPKFEAVQGYSCEEYQCIGSSMHAIFPDQEWMNEIKKREIAIRNLFKHSKRDLIRHYFINKGSYETKWIQLLQEGIIKVQLTLSLKQELLEQQQFGENQNSDPAVAFQQIQLAETQEQYQYCRRIKGVLDIDDEFDKLEFEAMKQRQERQEKKRQKRCHEENFDSHIRKEGGKAKQCQLKINKVWVEDSEPSQHNESKNLESSSKAKNISNHQECEIFQKDISSAEKATSQVDLIDLQTPAECVKKLQNCEEDNSSTCKDLYHLTKPQQKDTAEILQIGQKHQHKNIAVKAKRGVLRVVLKPEC